MSFSDRSIMDTIVTGVFDVDCCWCFTGLCVQQDWNWWEPGMFNILVFSHLKFHIFWTMAVFGLYFLPTLLSQICPGQLLVPVWVTQQLEQAPLFNIFWKCLCFERAGPMWRTLHFLQFTSFCCSDVWLFFGCVCLQTSRTLLKQLFQDWWWKFVFMFSGMTQKNKELFLHDHDPPHLKSQKVENSDMKLIQNPVLLLDWPHNHGGKGVLICAQGVCRHYRQKLFHMPVYLTALPVG